MVHDELVFLSIWFGVLGSAGGWFRVGLLRTQVLY